MTRTGMRLVPKDGNSLSDFTAYKSYKVIAGTGERNVSPFAQTLFSIHSENTANVIDDKGSIRFVSLDYFREFNLEMGSLVI